MEKLGAMVTTPRTFTAKDGRKVTLRSIRWQDLDLAVEFVNSLIEEGVETDRTVKITRAEEADWLGKRLARIEKGEIIDVVAELDNRLIANSEVERRTGMMSHLGAVGLAIMRGFRGIGVGTEIMRTLIDESRKAGLKVLYLDRRETNTVAKGLYEKMGFKETGRTPKAICTGDKYVDLVRMTLELQQL